MQVRIEVQGHTPLILNRFGEDAEASVSSGTSISYKGDKGTPLEIATKKLYVGRDGALMIPNPNILSCITQAGTFFKSGKRQLTTQKSSLIPACVEIEEIEIPLVHVEPWQVDTRPVRIPSTGGRILAHRPIFNDWRLSFTMNVDTELMPIKLMRDVVDAAGRRVGLGDFRPQCKGPYGKFVVSGWEEQK